MIYYIQSYVLVGRQQKNKRPKVIFFLVEFNWPLLAQKKGPNNQLCVAQFKTENIMDTAL